jgi:predicted nucleotidyltransferase
MDDELRRSIERAAAVLKDMGATEVYVFGSAATGTMREGSDVDLAVVGLPPGVFFSAMAGAADALGLGRELDLISLDDDNLFTRYLKRKGKLQRVA